MPKNANQKAKLLHLLRILWNDTDAEHRLTVPQLLKRLESKGIVAERKSIYSDLKVLEEEFDLDILPITRDRKGCALASRIFEVPEIGMLMDMVQSSRFLTAEKAAQLTDKLSRQLSRHQAARLKRQIWVTGGVAKAENQRIYYTLDQLSEAINNDHQVSYQYMEWTLDKGRCPRHGGRRYLVSPWALIFQDDNSYLDAYDGQEERNKHYRIDRIEAAREEMQLPREGRQAFEEAHPSTYARRMFGMYGGREERVTLHCSAQLLNALRDRFGTEVQVLPDPDRRGSTARVLVAVSPQFFAWVFGFGQEMEILGPTSVRQEYLQQLRNTLEPYRRSRTETAEKRNVQ